MGAVYRATDQVLARNVAIKVLKEPDGEELGKRIRLEAQILARLLHDNVVRIYDFGESENVYFLVMEEVDGTSFSKRWRLLPLAERLRICAQVSEALNYAHHQGVIHRDVKPANVLLTAGDQAKLSDFGLSMLVESKEDSGLVRGTPHYMSPEQARGKRLDHRTDLYSLGIMLYECATGAPPFLGQSMAVLAQHINAPVPPPRVKNPELSASLERLMLTLLSKNPDERPASGDEVGRMLREEADRERTRRPGITDGITIPANEAGTAATVTRALIDTGSSDAIAPGMHAKTEPGQVPISAPMPSHAASKLNSPLAAELLGAVLDAPLILSADERYLCGHYLAYLLGGSRRKGIFLQRPLDPRNADRARLILAMSWLMNAGPAEENVAKAAKLLDSRPEVRPALNPVVVMKYLACRATPARRKYFRIARKRLQDASTHASKAMLDPNGVLNPGLMPQNLDDLRKIAPARSEIDDLLVTRWNRVGEVWRENRDFRQAVLRYATSRAHKEPASADLWPEVVYPLIERARWQREFRPKHEALFDYLSAKVLRLPDAGVRLDRMIVKSVPAHVAEQLDEGFAAFVDDPRLDDDAALQEEGDERLTAGMGAGMSYHDLATDLAPRDKTMVQLTPVDPYRISQGDLRELWSEAMAVLGKPGGAKPRAVPIGPYRLAVIPSVRGRSAGQVALQGMRNKQIELLTPSIRAGGSGNKSVIAVWVYEDGSIVVVHLDFKGAEKYILWHAPNAQQLNYDDSSDLNHMLYTLGMELPEQLDRVLSKKFRPTSPA